jgi:hypothetical protein
MAAEKIVSTAGNRAVVIVREDSGYVWANVFVNARNGLADASITGLRWSGRTVAGALRWADRQLADAGV